MWRAPALDFIVNAGVTYQASTGMRVDRRASVDAAGEVAHLSYDAMLPPTTRAGRSPFACAPIARILKASCSARSNATHFAVGDVQGQPSRWSRRRAAAESRLPTGRCSTRSRSTAPASKASSPPAGTRELYRNGELLAFSRSNGDQRYHSRMSRWSMATTGSKSSSTGRRASIAAGSRRSTSARNRFRPARPGIGRASASPAQSAGKFVDATMATIRRREPRFPRPDLQAAVQVEHGLDKRTSVGVLATMLLADNERLTFVEGSVRRRSAPRWSRRRCARQQWRAAGGLSNRPGRSVNISADALVADDFIVNGKREKRHARPGCRSTRRSRIGRQPSRPWRRAVHRTRRRRPRCSTLRRACRPISTASTSPRWSIGSGDWARTAAGDRLEAALIGSGRIKDVRLRGEATWEVQPQNRFRTAELVRLLVGLRTRRLGRRIAYDADSKRGRARISHIRRFDSVAAAASIEAAPTAASPPGSISISRSIRRGGLKLTNQRLASTGSVEARVYRDLNDNGARDLRTVGEGALITTGSASPKKSPTSRAWSASADCSHFQPIAVGIDTSSLADPSLAPKKGAAGDRSRGPASPPRSRSAWSAPAISKACWSATTAAASKGSMSSWSMLAARSSHRAQRLRRLLPVRTGRLWPLQPSASPPIRPQAPASSRRSTRRSRSAPTRPSSGSSAIRIPGCADRHGRAGAPARPPQARALTKESSRRLSGIRRFPQGLP